MSASSVVPSTLDWFSALRKLLLITTTLIIYDAFFLFQTELRYVWKGSPWFARIAYGISRYGVLVVMAVFITICMPQGTFTDYTCLSLARVATALYFVVDLTGNMLTGFRVFKIWNRNRKVLRLLLFGAACASFAGLGSMIATNHKMGSNGSVIWSGDIPWGGETNLNPFRACLLAKGNYYIAIVYISQAVFDVYALILVLCNAVDIPRRQDQGLREMLVDHGAPLMTLIFVLRAVNVILTFTNVNTTSEFGIMFCAPLISMLNARLFINSCRFYERPEHDAIAHVESDSEEVE